MLENLGRVPLPGIGGRIQSRTCYLRKIENTACSLTRFSFSIYFLKSVMHKIHNAWKDKVIIMKKYVSKSKRLTCILLSLVLTLAMAACGGTKDESPVSSESAAQPQSSAASEESVSEIPESSEPSIIESAEEIETSEPAAARTVTDQAGRSVELSEEVNKIVSGYYISTSACISLELTDKLAGIEAKADSRPIYKMRAAELLELPSVGSAKEFDLEGCIALEPDLVILPKRLSDAADTMAELGIAVILVNPESEAELLEMVELIAEAAGVTERADEVTSKYKEFSGKIEELAAGAAEKPSVYMGGNDSYLSAAVGSMYQSELIEKSGGVNTAAELTGDGWTETSYEQLLAWDPDVIVIPSEASYTKDDVLNDPQLADLRAVQEGKVYAMPSAFEAWDSPTMSGAAGMAWMLHVLQSELYTMDQLKADAADFYENIYGLEIDTALIET